VKSAQTLILVPALLILLALPLAAFAGGEEDYRFYVFADSRCPHCRSLIEFFREQGYRHSVCYVDLSTACDTLFLDLLGVAGLPGVVPVAVVVVDGRVSGIVVGALRDVQFWEMVKSGVGGGDIPVYMATGDGAAKAGLVPAQREAEVLSLLDKFLVEEQAGVSGPVAEAQATQAGEERGSGLLLASAILAFLAGVLAYILVVESGVLRRIPGR